MGLGAVALVLGVAGWAFFGPETVGTAPEPSPGMPPVAAPSALAPVLEAAASPAAVATEGAEAAPSPAAVSAAERLQASVSDLERRDRAHRLELERERARIALEVQRGHEVRRRSEAPVGPRPVAAEPGPAEAAAASVTPAPVPATTVDQVCAASGNFLARDFCRMRECGQPTFASDPVCVRFRQMDEARRQQGG